MSFDYDVIVVGAGHAGTEASVLAARLGAKVLLLTSNLDTIGQMSCNPAIGGIAKGTVVREIDALGGIMGRATDRATIQFRMLNRSKGPAVWAPRAQCDRTLYRRAVRSLLEGFSGLELTQGMVTRLLTDGARVSGVVTADGRSFHARAVVLTAGTFLRGRIHLGTDTQIPAGRAGDQPTGAALLSIGGGQDREVPRRQAPPGVPRTRRTRHTRAVRERAVHFPARPGAARVPARRAGSRARNDDPAGLCHRV